MGMKPDYYEDVQVITSKLIIFWLGVLIIALAVFPFIPKNDYVYVANLCSLLCVVLYTWKASLFLFHHFY